MSDKPTFQVTQRADSGKGVARKLRAAGKIPGVCYGNGENHTVTADPDELYKMLTGPFRTNLVFALAIDDGPTFDYVMVRDYQVDPVRRDLLHADFVVVDPETPVKVTVPVETTGRARGVREGGRLRAVRPEVEITACPGNIPVKLVHDVTPLGLGEAFRASEIELPEGVEFAFKQDYAVFQVNAPRGAKKVAEEA